MRITFPPGYSKHGIPIAKPRSSDDIKKANKKKRLTSYDSLVTSIIPPPRTNQCPPIMINTPLGLAIIRPCGSHFQAASTPCTRTPIAAAMRSASGEVGWVGFAAYEEDGDGGAADEADFFHPLWGGVGRLVYVGWTDERVTYFHGHIVQRIRGVDCERYRNNECERAYALYTRRSLVNAM